MSTKTKSSSNLAKRQQATMAAVASVRAEGLTPTPATSKRLDQYARGIITADQLYRQTLSDVKARAKHTVS